MTRSIIKAMGYKKNEKGQVAILFALVFTFMFILFAFVVDFGHLINDKINLQIAADQAAYAGAAWQARLLDKISMVNYKLRQNVKELAMRVNVTHLRHNRNFPRGMQYINGGRQAAQVDPFICQQAHGYQSISGLRYDVDTNLCRNADYRTGGLPPIVVPPVIAQFDPFAHAIAAQIRRIQVEANRECRAAASDNKVLSEYISDVYTRRSRFHANQIEELKNYVNQIANENITSSHPAIAASYQTALRNLSISNTDGFKMEILKPTGGEYLRLEPYKLGASLFYIRFNVQGDGCVGLGGQYDFNDLIAGYTKKQGVLTHFAVKLTSRPKLFFMPAAWTEALFPELVAFSAAKPFGSRIGPGARADNLLPTPGRPNNTNRMLNFSFFPNDNLGLRSSDILAYLDGLHPYNRIGRPDGNQSTWPEPNRAENIRQALKVIRAPTIFDAIMYTVYPDPGNNMSTDYFEPQFASNLYPDYYEATSPEGNVINTPTPRTPAYLPASVGSRNRGTGWIQSNAENTGAGGPYRGYAEEQIGSHSVTSILGMPLMNDEAIARKFGFAGPSLIHSAFTPRNQQPRIGYSVKFVPMDQIMRTGLAIDFEAGTRQPYSNKPTGDPNLRYIRH